MSLDPSSCDSFPPFLVKITILIPHLLVMTKGSSFTLTQVCCCSVGDRSRAGSLSCAPPAHLFPPSTHQSWAVEPEQVERQQKDFQISGYLGLVLSAILHLARKASCTCCSTLIWGCGDEIPRPLSLQMFLFQLLQEGMLALSLPAVPEPHPKQTLTLQELGLRALPTQHQPAPAVRDAEDFVLTSNNTDCFANEIN